MKTIISSVEEFESRLNKNILPLGENNEVDNKRVMLALEDATGIIVSHLHWLVDENKKELIENIPVKFESALKAICTDIALIRLTDSIASSEDTREQYKASVSLLEKIHVCAPVGDKEYKGGLAGPNHQYSEIIDESSDEVITDKRYFKKGRVF